jgi:tRNA uridine 5-carboxymethylaminomethyl modification enzyme
MAGINAGLKVKNEPPLILDRTEAYTAILIDDLISKGTNEPYRMFTSRAEFRLHLRIDNADRRLTPHGRRVGLISDEVWQEYLTKQERQDRMKELLSRVKVTPAMLGSIQHSAISTQPSNDRVGTATPGCPGEQGSAQQTQQDGRSIQMDFSSAVGQPLAQLLKRPEVTIEGLVPILRELNPEFFAREADDLRRMTNDEKLPSAIRNELKSVETEIKYEGYLQQQQRAIERLKKAEKRTIPEWFEYKSVSGLSREMQEKLTKLRPRTLGQASRIPGVTPAAVSLVNVYIEIQAKRREQATVLQP